MTHRYYVLWGVLIHVIISLATLVKNMRQILYSDWLTEWAWWAHPAYSELTSLILLKKRIEWSGLEKFNNVYLSPTKHSERYHVSISWFEEAFSRRSSFCTLIPTFSINKDSTDNVHFNASQSMVRDISVMGLWSSVFGWVRSSVHDTPTSAIKIMTAQTK